MTTTNEEDVMRREAHSATDRRESELWTRDDAELMRDADLGSDPESWMDDDLLLDGDLWADTEDDLSAAGLRRLGIRVS